MKSTRNRYEWSTHRTNDPTNYLKVRVTLHYDQQSSPIPKIDDDEGEDHSQHDEKVKKNEEGSDDSMQDLDNKNKKETKREDRQSKRQENPNQGPVVREICWQERIFSPQEVQSHINDANVLLCQNPIRSTKLHEMIASKLEKDPRFIGEPIFTRTKDDDYIDPSEIDTPFYGEIGTRPPTDLAKAIFENEGPQPMLDIVHTTSTSMHIFSAIKGPDGYTEDLLGIIRVYSGGRIDVRPPFSNKTTPQTTYDFFSKNNEHIFYTIEVIEDKPDEGSLYDETLKTDISRRRAIFENGQSECKLSQLPDAGTIRMFYMGQISLARMEDVPGVMVEWAIKVPNDWEIEPLKQSSPEEGQDINTDQKDIYPQFSGCSQYALCNKNGVAHINLPIELTAICKSQVAPTLNIILHTFNSAGARAVVGYGSAPLPMYPGRHIIKLKTWRVRGTISQELKLLFLYSGLEQQPDVDSNFENSDVNSALNKFGLKTIGTGEVEAEFNLGMQSSLFKKKVTGITLNPMTNLGGDLSQKYTLSRFMK